MRLQIFIWAELQSYVLDYQRIYSEYMQTFELDSYIEHYSESSYVPLDPEKDQSEPYYEISRTVANIKLPSETTAKPQPLALPETTSVTEIKPGVKCQTTQCQSDGVIKIIRKIEDTTDHGWKY